MREQGCQFRAYEGTKIRKPQGHTIRSLSTIMLITLLLAWSSPILLATGLSNIGMVILAQNTAEGSLGRTSSPAEALFFFDTAIRLVESPRFRANLGKTLLVLGRSSESVDEFRKAGIERSVDWLLSVAFAAYRRKDYDKSLETVGAAAELFQESSSIKCFRGHLFQRTGNLDKAMEKYDQSVISGNFDHPIIATETLCHYWRGDALLQLMRFDEAKKEMEYVIGREPENSNALLLLGLVHVEEGNEADAEVLLLRALRLNPDNVWVYLHLANVYWQLGAMEQAELWFERAVYRFPDNALLAIRAGRFHLSQRNPSRAKELLEGAASMEPLNAVAHYEYSRSLMEEGDYEGAIRELRSAITIDNSNASAFILLGYAWVAVQDFEQAAVAFQAALTLDEYDEEAQYMLNCLERLQQTGELVCPTGRLQDK